jgi:plasmid stabilization system protein ParE
VKLQTFAPRGVPRDDLLPARRITGFRKRAIISDLLDEEVVSMVGVFDGGQDYEASADGWWPA